MLDFEKYQEKISGICRKYHVINLTAFGSAVSGNFNEQSNIDFLIEFDGAQDGIKRYMNVKFEIESLFSRPIDLVMPRAIKNKRIRKCIFSNIRIIYAS